MKALIKSNYVLYLLAMCALLALALSACSSPSTKSLQDVRQQTAEHGPDTSRFLVAIEDEPDTVDFQCTSIHYTIATNVFNRLVETKADADGKATIVPSLAESWDVSEDGRSYTFHLREGVTFSNGSALTSSDVLYTFTRLLTHPDSCNRDIVETIEGADQLEQGKSDQLQGFQIIDDQTFAITLKQPFEAFLACLSMPGASIMDEQTVRASGDRFGKDAADTIGTGPFILHEWEPGKGMLLTANKDCWEGAPKCEGLDLRFITDQEEARMLFENGELDILDLDEVGNSAEFFIHGDIYQNRLYRVPRIALTYIALNESIVPLNDVRVRKALQLSLNRQMLLDALYGGRGSVENGIYPHGLYGFNPNLPGIPYDLNEAKRLLQEAGYPDGFALTYTVKSTSAQWEATLARLVTSMWADIGVRVSINVLDEDSFMAFRKNGKLACYAATWTADYDDPDNFIYTFFGNRENTNFRSLRYSKEDVMKRVREARTIADPDKRLREYQELERIIVQEDAAWIPLFSRLYHYVTSERVGNVIPAWNGSVKNEYRNVTIADTP